MPPLLFANALFTVWPRCLLKSTHPEHHRYINLNKCRENRLPEAKVSVFCEAQVMPATAAVLFSVSGGTRFMREPSCLEHVISAIARIHWPAFVLVPHRGVPYVLHNLTEESSTTGCSCFSLVNGIKNNRYFRSYTALHADRKGIDLNATKNSAGSVTFVSDTRQPAIQNLGQFRSLDYDDPLPDF